MICIRSDLLDSRPAITLRYLGGHLHVPIKARGLVILAHLPGQGLPYPLLRSVVRGLHRAGLATCTVDLVEAGEAEDEAKLADVPFLAQRLRMVVDFLSRRPETAGLPTGLLASQLAAAAAVTVAVEEPDLIRAVVCFSGRPDLAEIDFSRLNVPTMLVVPGRHQRLVQSNERVFWKLDCTSQFAVIRGASPQFIEPGTLVAAQQVVIDWCTRHIDRALQPIGEAGNRQPQAAW
jgi:putative phosphoribosyl transferase